MMAKIYVYTRVSTEDQAAALAQQDRVAMEEAKIAQIRHPHASEIIGPWADKASAFKIPFHQRPMGRLICELLQPGDIVVFSRLDRFVRLGKDFELQFEDWNNKGITIIFADLKVDMSTAAGGMVARMFAAFAQYFSESLSERQKLSWRERYVHGTKFHSGWKVLVRKVLQSGNRNLTVPNWESILYLRYVVHRRRISALRNGLPDSWDTISDDLERLRAARGDIPAYRPLRKRAAWCGLSIQRNLRTLMSTELPALNAQSITRYFREGLNPFELGRKKAGVPKGYKLKPRTRETLHAYRQAQNQPIVRKVKRWSRRFDCCTACGRTDRRHFNLGLCRPCYRALKENGQPTEAA